MINKLLVSEQPRSCCWEVVCYYVDQIDMVGLKALDSIW